MRGWKYLLLIAFVSGMSVMAFEVSAARLLAPFFGTSLFVWSNILGVVMVSLAIGYYVGGKLADRWPDLTLLLKLVVGAGFFFLIVPLLIKPIASAVTVNTFFVNSGAVVIFVGSLLVALILFALPLMVLGMVSPFIIKLYSMTEKQVGEVSGAVFAISTVGSLVGTFLPTLWLIPAVGTKRTIMIFAIVLVLVAAYGIFKKKAWMALILLVLAPLPTLAGTTVKDDPTIIHETESLYQYIQVKQVNEDVRHLIFNEGGGVQSVYNAKNPLTSGLYYDYYSLLPYLVDAKPAAPKDVLLVGLAGGSISRQLHHFFPGEVKIDGVEIDQEIIDIAEEYFELENPDLTVFHNDGRIFMQSTDKQYDIIIVDAYSQQLYIAWNLTTEEFWQAVKERTADGGIVGLNINATSFDSELMRAVTNTMAKVFPYVYAAPAGPDRTWNYMVMASSGPIDFDPLLDDALPAGLKAYANGVAHGSYRITYDNRKPVLTDDWAPVEFMTDKMIYSYLIEHMRDN